MITTIIFDLGGVLIPEKGQEIHARVARHIGVSSQTLENAHTPYKDTMTKGEITLKDTYETIQRSLGKTYAPEEIVAVHLQAYMSLCTKRDERIITLIERLRRRYKVVALTNTEQEIEKFNKQRRGEEGKTLFGYFHQAFISTDMRMKKPDAIIYETALKELSIKPENAIFIDDNQKYIDGARNVGITSILYKDPEQLRKELKTFDVTF